MQVVSISNEKYFNVSSAKLFTQLERYAKS